MNHGTCIHFTGIGFCGGNSKCKAGVDYRMAFDGSRPGIMLRAPCVAYRIVPAHGRGTLCKPDEPTVRKEIDRRDEVVMECQHRLEPTADQVKQDRIEFEQSFEKVLAGIKVASEWRVKPKPAENRREVVDCPVCKGKLHLSQSSHNGHVHGKCETDKCVSWME